MGLLDLRTFGLETPLPNLGIFVYLTLFGKQVEKDFEECHICSWFKFLKCYSKGFTLAIMN